MCSLHRLHRSFVHVCATVWLSRSSLGFDRGNPWVFMSSTFCQMQETGRLRDRKGSRIWRYFRSTLLCIRMIYRRWLSTLAWLDGNDLWGNRILTHRYASFLRFKDSCSMTCPLEYGPDLLDNLSYNSRHGRVSEGCEHRLDCLLSYQQLVDCIVSQQVLQTQYWAMSAQRYPGHIPAPPFADTFLLEDTCLCTTLCLV